MNPVALVVVVLLVLVLIGALPAWGIHQYGYYPSGGILGLLLLLVFLRILGII